MPADEHATLREIALRIAYQYAIGHLVDEAALKILQALQAADRRAREDAARIAKEKRAANEPFDEWLRGYNRACEDITAAISGSITTEQGN